MLRKNKAVLGFTLIEVLVSMILVTTVGSIIISIFFGTLRGTNKSNVLTGLRQNGDFALFQIEKMVRFAKSLDSPVSCITTPAPLSSITTTYLDDGKTTFACRTTEQDIASNS